MIRIIALVSFTLLSSFFVEAQIEEESWLKPSDTLNTSRRNAVLITEASVMTLGLIGLNELWYDDFERSSFQTIDDSDEWYGIDKAGHVFSAYQLNRLISDSYTWSGASEKQSLVLGAGFSLGFLTAIEVMDGFSAEWGFSWPDFASNFLGSGIYVGQELLWNEQRLMLKFSYHNTKFAQMNPDKLGEGTVERIFKDYNGQTIWLSSNIKSLLNLDKFPAWLNLAFGFGAHGMLTGTIPDAGMPFSEQKRYAQYYLSLDLDLTRIKTNNNLLKTVFSVINTLKIPAPTIAFDNGKKITFYPLYF